jgi:hypothetical protein
LEQLSKVIEDVLAHTDMWGLLPPGVHDRTPSGVDDLGVTLAFIDANALYRLRGWIQHGGLSVNVDRIPFNRLTHVRFADHDGRISRSWQFLNEGESINLLASEGPEGTELVHELVRRTGWPLP